MYEGSPLEGVGPHVVARARAHAQRKLLAMAEASGSGLAAMTGRRGHSGNSSSSRPSQGRFDAAMEQAMHSSPTRNRSSAGGGGGNPLRSQAARGTGLTDEDLMGMLGLPWSDRARRARPKQQPRPSQAAFLRAMRDAALGSPSASQGAQHSPSPTRSRSSYPRPISSPDCGRWQVQQEQPRRDSPAPRPEPGTPLHTLVATCRAAGGEAAAQLVARMAAHHSVNSLAVQLVCAQRPAGSGPSTLAAASAPGPGDRAAQQQGGWVPGGPPLFPVSLATWEQEEEAAAGGRARGRHRPRGGRTPSARNAAGGPSSTRTDSSSSSSSSAWVQAALGVSAGAGAGSMAPRPLLDTWVLVELARSMGDAASRQWLSARLAAMPGAGAGPGQGGERGGHGSSAGDGDVRFMAARAVARAVLAGVPG